MNLSTDMDEFVTEHRRCGGLKDRRRTGQAVHGGAGR
jgi:hypothetical protein